MNGPVLIWPEGGNSMYGRTPLFPPSCCNSSMRMPLFDNCTPCKNACEDCQTVRICNPVCRDEFVDVELCVDSGGNLSICVHRPPKPCRPRSCRNRCHSEWTQWNRY